MPDWQDNFPPINFLCNQAVKFFLGPFFAQKCRANHNYAKSTLSLLALGGLILIFAIDGLICLLMALPLALILALIGAALGRWLGGSQVTKEFGEKGWNNCEREIRYTKSDFKSYFGIRGDSQV